MRTLLPLILGAIFQTASYGQSLFQQHTFAGGITIQIPKNWKVLDTSTTQQLDTNAEATTGITQGNNKILLAANLYLAESVPSATIRLSVRNGPTLTESQFEAIPEAEFQAQADNNRTIVERNLQPAGYSLVMYSECREKLAGHTAHTSTYISAEKGRQIVNILSILFLGDRNIKLHTTYDASTGTSTKATVNRIRSSLTTPKSLFVDASAATPAQQPAYVQSKDHNFAWPIPASWEQTAPRTAAQYALQVKGSQGAFNCSLLVAPKKFSIEQLIEDQKSNPRVYFDNAVLPRFPDSKFIASSVSMLGSQNAILTEYVYTAKNLDAAFSFHAFTLVTVWKDHFYIMTFECSTKDAEFGRALFQHLIAGFTFS
jgi:hypothetical protein